MDLFNARMIQQGADKLLKPEMWLKVTSQADKVNAAEHQLSIARDDQRISFFYHPFQIHGPALSMKAGNNEERAAVVASILHFQVGPGLFCNAFAGKDRGGD